MFENLAVIAALAIVVWVISFLVYFYSFRQQKDLEGDLELLQEKLDQSK